MLALAAVNYRGVTRTARLTRVIVVVVLLALVTVVAAGLLGGRVDPGPVVGGLGVAGAYGVLQSAGLLFFAFAGYARIATMGEEVREPQKTIPRAILLAMGIAVVVYAIVAMTALLTLGPERLARSSAPLVDVVASGAWGWAAPIAVLGGAAASLGALLALMGGIGRTTLAMAREDDLPRLLAAVHPRFRVPHRAEVVLAVIVSVLVIAVDLRGAIGFSSFGVLLYYLVANLSAFTQEPGLRLFPRWLQVLGAVGCLVLVAALPWQAVAVGTGVLVVGVAYRSARLAVAHRRPRSG